MSNKKQETLADIVAEMRGMGNYQQYSSDHARALADRIEAAAAREREAIIAEAQRSPRSWEDCVVEYQKKKEAGEYGPY